jgi:3-methyladenine DNA glycosylase AlkD
MHFEELIKDLKQFSDEKQAKILSRFFKTGKGEYGEGDIFLGIKVPDIRKVAKKYVKIELNEIQKTLDNKHHEVRLCGALILTYKYEKTKTEEEKKDIYEFYMKNYNAINNWDLVDLTAPKISGPYLFDKDKKILHEWVESKNLWKRRIAVLSTFYFIRQNDFSDCLIFCQKLLGDKHDLMHKACGWMLREIGKRDEKVLTEFLDKYVKKMPRTMLRYSIERLEEKKRLYYLKL